MRGFSRGEGRHGSRREAGEPRIPWDMAREEGRALDQRQQVNEPESECEGQVGRQGTRSEDRCLDS